MNAQLEELLEAGQDTIGQIEDAKEALESANEALASANSDIDNTLCDLSKQAEELQRQIVAVRNEAPHMAHPIHALALSATIDILRGMLGEAIAYLDQGEHLAALGTMVLFDDQAEDVKAAIRLFRRDVQSDGRRK